MQEKIKVVKVTEKPNYTSYELCDLSLPDAKVGNSNDYIMNEGEHLLSHSFFMKSMSRLMGKSLTIIDASIVDKQHNKAVKDLIRNIFSDEMDHESSWAYDQAVISKMAEESMPEDPADWESISIEEALGVK